MTTLTDLETLIPDIIRRMEDIASAASRYKHFNRDGRARVLINEINGKIKQIKKVHETYKKSPSFQNQNFDSYIEMLENQIKEFKNTYDIIMQMNDIPYYY